MYASAQAHSLAVNSLVKRRQPFNRGIFPNLCLISRNQLLSNSFSRASSTSRGSDPSVLKMNIPDWASKEAREAVQGLVQKFYPESKTQAQFPRPATAAVQMLDRNQLTLLRTLLHEMISLPEQTQDSASQSASEPLLPSEHLIYFTPTSQTSTLGRDGSDTTFNPPGDTFVRRMWAGGKMIWNRTSESNQTLQTHDQAKEETFIEEVTVKKTKQGHEMLLVWVRKEYRIWTESGWSDVLLRDRRSWIYQKSLPSTTSFESRSPQTPNLYTSAQRRSDAIPACFTTSEIAPSTLTSTSLLQSPTHLFRYSALTYNGHAIHLCPVWAKEKEGHEERVVHGPLNLNLIMRQFQKRFGSERTILEVDYRAKSPVYVGERYSIRFRNQKYGIDEPEDEPQRFDEIEIVKVAGEREVVVMEARITSQRS